MREVLIPLPGLTDFAAVYRSYSDSRHSDRTRSGRYRCREASAVTPGTSGPRMGSGCGNGTPKEDWQDSVVPPSKTQESAGPGRYRVSPT